MALGQVEVWAMFECTDRVNLWDKARSELLESKANKRQSGWVGFIWQQTITKKEGMDKDTAE